MYLRIRTEELEPTSKGNDLYDEKESLHPLIIPWEYICIIPVYYTLKYSGIRC